MSDINRYDDPLVQALSKGLTPEIRQAIADNWRKTGCITDEQFYWYSSKSTWWDLLFEIADQHDDDR